MSKPDELSSNPVPLPRLSPPKLSPAEALVQCRPSAGRRRSSNIRGNVGCDHAGNEGGVIHNHHSGIHVTGIVIVRTHLIVLRAADRSAPNDDADQHQEDQKYNAKKPLTYVCIT